MIEGETMWSGAPLRCEECGVEPELGVYRSNAGHYVGAWCNCGPYSRESGYYRTREEAEIALKTNTFGR